MALAITYWQEEGTDKWIVSLDDLVNGGAETTETLDVFDDEAAAKSSAEAEAKERGLSCYRH